MVSEWWLVHSTEWWIHSRWYHSVLQTNTQQGDFPGPGTDHGWLTYYGMSQVNLNPNATSKIISYLINLWVCNLSPVRTALEKFEIAVNFYGKALIRHENGPNFLLQRRASGELRFFSWEVLSSCNIFYLFLFLSSCSKQKTQELNSNIQFLRTRRSLIN